MTAAPSIDNPPSLSSSVLSHSRNGHQALGGLSTTREVVTAPPWAQDEPPSPTDQPLDNDRSVSIADHRPSASTSSIGRLPSGSLTDHRSRWWTFARPRGGSRYPPRYGVTLTASADPSTSRHDQGSLWKEKDSIDGTSSFPSSTLPRPPRPIPQNFFDTNSTWRSRIEFPQGDHGDYAHLGGGSTVRHDDESAMERSTLSRSKRGFRVFILSNIYVPLLFRFINITFTTAALAVAIRIRELEIQYSVMGILGSSPTLVIIFAPLTLVHVMVAIYLEYFGRPLGLWRTSGKLAHTLLEVCFICAWSAALSLCFDNFFTSLVPCASSSGIAWYSQLPRAELLLPDLQDIEGSVGDTLCDSQLALICLVGVGLVMYCTNLVISLFRIFEKVKYHAGVRLRV